MAARLVPSQPLRASVVAVGLAFGVWVVVVARLPAGAFWITDEGNRWLQLEALARTGAPDVGRLWDGWQTDPDGVYFPTAGHHFLRQGQRVVSFYPPYLALLTWPAVRWLGETALYLWPLAGLLATAALFPWLVAGLGARARLALVASLPLVASPLLFYACGFWEQPLATAFGSGALLALLAAVRRDRARDALLGGLLLGVTTWLREEGYLLAAAWGVGMLVAGWAERRRTSRTLAAAGLGFLAIVVPLWIVQARLWGAPFGLHTVVYASLDAAHSLRGELGDAVAYLFAFGASPSLAALLILLFGPALLVGSLWTRPAGAWRTVGLTLSAGGAVVALVVLLADSEPVLGTLHRQSLLPHAPILALGALSLRRRLADPEIGRRMVGWTMVLYTLGLVWLLHRGDVGVIWGPRHFLPVLPALLALAVLAVDDERSATLTPNQRRLERLSIAALLLAGLVVQIEGLRLLLLKREAGSALLAAVREAPARAVVTDQYWLPEELATLWGEKTFFAVDDDRGLEQVLERLRGHGEVEVLVLLSADHGPVSAAARERLAHRAIARRLVGRRGVSFLAVDGLLVRLSPKGAIDGG